MKSLPQGVTNRPPQTHIAKPAIRNNEEWRCGKMAADADQHQSCLFQFGLKRHDGAFDFGGSLFRSNGFLGEVKKRFFLMPMPNKVTKERSKLDVMDEVNGTITASSV